jgi:hypothetical protein
VPVNSDYKGFPVCQAVALPVVERHTNFVREVKLRSEGCGQRNYKRSLMQQISAADPDERRARGPQSLAEDQIGFPELNRLAPRRSNLHSHQRLPITR